MASAGLLPASECRSWRPAQTLAVCLSTSKYSYRFRINGGQRCTWCRPPFTELNTKRVLTMVPSFSISLSPTFPSWQCLPSLMEPVYRMLGTLASRTEGIFCLGKRKRAATIYHIIWTELSKDTPTVPFVGKGEWTGNEKLRNPRPNLS